MRCANLVAVLLLLRTPLAHAQRILASQPIRRLTGAAFPHLPRVIRADLRRRTCLVPQPWGERAPENVIAGAFTAARAHEWAILCSVHDTSQILIYRIVRGKPVYVVDSLLSASDQSWMQDVGGGQLGFSRLLRTMPLRFTRHWRKDIDGHAIPQPVDHDAIEQAFVGKAAEAFYYVAGRLYRQVTAD